MASAADEHARRSATGATPAIRILPRRGDRPEPAPRLPRTLPGGLVPRAIMPEPMRLRHPLRAWWQATPVDRASEPQLLPETAPHGRTPEWRFAAVVIISPQSAGRAGPSNAHDRGGDALRAEAAIGNGPRSHVSAAFLGAIAEPRVRRRISGGIRHDRRRGFAKISARPGGGGLSPPNGRQWARLGILHRARRRRRVARQRDRRNETHPGLRPFGTSRLYSPRPTAAPRRLKGIPAPAELRISRRWTGPAERRRPGIP